MILQDKISEAIINAADHPDTEYRTTTDNDTYTAWSPYNHSIAYALIKDLTADNISLTRIEYVNQNSASRCFNILLKDAV